MDLDKTFGTDKSLEEDGVWIDLGDDSQIKIARLGNKKSQEISSKIQKNAQMASKYSLTDLADNDLNYVLATAIIIDWKNIKVKGKILEYSSENAKKMLEDYKDFRSLVIELASEMETFRRVEVEEGKENLKKS